jgi:signal peptidase II
VRKVLKKKYHLMVWPALFIIILDQITKAAIVRSLSLHEAVPILPGCLNLVHVRNRGIAFGLMNRPDNDFNVYLLALTSVLAVFLILFWAFKLKEGEGPVALGLSLLMGGALGNLMDRIRLHEVVDFVDVYLGSYHWPAFNVADSAITVGTLWLAKTLVFPRKARA